MLTCLTTEWTCSVLQEMFQARWVVKVQKLVNIVFSALNAGKHDKTWTTVIGKRIQILMIYNSEHCNILWEIPLSFLNIFSDYATWLHNSIFLLFDVRSLTKRDYWNQIIILWLIIFWRNLYVYLLNYFVIFYNKIELTGILKAK